MAKRGKRKARKSRKSSRYGCRNNRGQFTKCGGRKKARRSSSRKSSSTRGRRRSGKMTRREKSRINKAKFRAQRKKGIRKSRKSSSGRGRRKARKSSRGRSRKASRRRTQPRKRTGGRPTRHRAAGIAGVFGVGSKRKAVRAGKAAARAGARSSSSPSQIRLFQRMDAWARDEDEDGEFDIGLGATPGDIIDAWNTTHPSNRLPGSLHGAFGKWLRAHHNDLG